MENTAEDLSPGWLVPAQRRSLWRDALQNKNSEELRKFRRTHVVRVRSEDLKKFRLAMRAVLNRATVQAAIADTRKHLRSAQTGEKALWESVLFDLTSRNSQKDAVPILPRCQFCGDPFVPRQRNSPKDRCGSVDCRRKADAKRMWEKYHSDPTVRRRKIAAVKRRRREMTGS